MAHYNFRKDLAVAKKTEEQVGLILEQHYALRVLGYENTNKYDILAETTTLSELYQRQFTFEVKEDFMCVKTGNVALEFECRGKPSGISVCEADYYIYKLTTPDIGTHFVMHTTPILKEMIADKRYSRIVNGGDRGSNTMNYLFKYKAFVSRGHIIAVMEK